MGFLMGAAPSRTKTYTAGEVISPDDVTENEDNIYGYLQGGVDTYKAGSIENAAIKDGTIADSKLVTTPGGIAAGDSIAFTGATTEVVRKSISRLRKRYGKVAPEQGDVIAVLGGDGGMLESLYKYFDCYVPLFGLQLGTVGRW